MLGERAELEAAGVIDPDAPDAPSRREIAEHLRSAGLGIEEIVAVFRSAEPQAAATHHILFPPPHLTEEEFVERIGLSAGMLDRLRVAIGLPPPDRMHIGHDSLHFSEHDVAAFATISSAIELFGEEGVLRFLRVMGAAVAQVAEAAVALFATNVARPLEQQGASEAARFKADVEGTRGLVSVAAGLDPLFRHHAEIAIRRLQQAGLGLASFGSGRFVVGFIDLVGFTPLAANLQPQRLAAVFDEYEAMAFDVISQHDARLVKLIGDAVMFAALDTDAACDIALTLVERFSDDETVRPRGALASGEMLVRGGDYYGPVVNLAARAADLAVPGEILVSDAVVNTANPSFRFDPAGRRLLKGFAEPIALSTLART